MKKSLCKVLHFQYLVISLQHINNQTSLLKINIMISKSRIKTTEHNGIRFLSDKKTGSFICFATLKVAENNAKKYSDLLGVIVTVYLERNIYFLTVDCFIYAGKVSASNN